jgi:hypothetical protein
MSRSEDILAFRPKSSSDVKGTSQQQSHRVADLPICRRLESVRFVLPLHYLTAKAQILSALLRDEKEVLKVKLLIPVFVSSANRTETHFKMVADQHHRSETLQLIVEVVRVPAQEGAILFKAHKLVVFVLCHYSLQCDLEYADF